jgi:CRISPR-associated protein Cas2
VLWIVAYDIVCDRRRARVHRFLEEEGIRTQKSVFLCELSAAKLQAVSKGLAERVEPSEDQIRLHPLCNSCATRTMVVGRSTELENHGGFLRT